MSLFVAWVVFPLVLLALCLGLGLLVDLLSGRRLPGALLAPAGLAAMIVAGGFTAASDATAELTVPLLLGLALLGAGLSWPWRYSRPDPLPTAAALAVFAIFAAPVVLSGEPTFAGYIKLDDTATWLAMTDRIMEHGRSLDGLGPSSYRATLDFNLAGGYPIGVFVPFGTGQKLVGGDLAWVFQPYVSFLMAMLSLSLWQVLGGAVRRSRPLAFAVFIAAQPALLYGYAMWGGVKEVAAAALIALAAALAPAVVRASDIHPTRVGSKSDASSDGAGGSPFRDVFPLALAAAALVGVLSPGGVIWLLPMLLALGVLAWRRFGPPAAALRAALFTGLLVAFVFPALTSGIVPPTSKPLTDDTGEGNLRGPLDPLQGLGIWPVGDFRFDPEPTVATAVLIGLGILAALFGLWFAWRRRSLAPLLYAGALFAAALIVTIGSPWAGAKALATVSPVALSLAALGALAALRLDRVAGSLLVVAVAGGVLWSNVLAYGGVSLAPYGQLQELQQIGEDFAGEGPALMTEYSPYGARHFLRELDGEAASELRERTVPTVDGGTVDKGYSVDTDELDLAGLLEFRTLVLRRPPARSRPPSPYSLVRAGDYYDVWQRPEAYAGLAPERLPLGDESDPSAVPDCGEVGDLGRLALRNGARDVRLLAARHAPIYDATEGSLEVPRAGRYAAWLKGSVRGSAELLVDGEVVGDVRHELNNEGGFVDLGEAQLAAGSHEVELRFGGADMHPGSGGFPRPPTGPLLFAPAGEEAGEIVSVPVSEYERLCGKPWDWIEAVASG
jgi:hypothetical protein